MSGTTQQMGTPARAGSTLQQAETSIEAILDREAGKPAASTRPPVPRREPASRTQEHAAPPADADPDEALPEAEDDDADDLDAAFRTDDPDDDGDEEATTDEDTDEDPEPKTREFTVKIDGKALRVPETELLNGYLRQVDYTRKTMAHAEERKAFHAELSELRTERAQYAELLPVLNEQLKQLQGQDIDWEALYQQNPTEWMHQRAIQEDIRDRQRAALQEQYRLHQISEQERAQERTLLLQNEREMVNQKVPQWQSDTEWAKATGVARKFAEEMGYSEAQIREVTDHRAVMALFMAARYQELIKRGIATPNRPRIEATPPDPGPHPMRRRISEHTRNKQRLAKSHSMADAAAVIRGLL